MALSITTQSIPDITQAGGNIIINGTGFNNVYSGGSVQIFDSTGKNYYEGKSGTDTQMTVTAGALPPGSGYYIHLFDGTNTANSVTFNVTAIPVPTISGLSQTSGSQGSKLTITGTNFNTTPGQTTVAIGGINATIDPSTPVTSTSITVIVPNNSPGFVGNVVVTSQGVSNSGTNNFTYTAPLVTLNTDGNGLNPSSGSLNQILEFEGTNFGTDITQVAVKFTNRNAPYDTVTVPYISNITVPQPFPSPTYNGPNMSFLNGLGNRFDFYLQTPTELNASVYDVSVIVGGGTPSNSLPFTYEPSTIVIPPYDLVAPIGSAGSNSIVSQNSATLSGSITNYGSSGLNGLFQFLWTVENGSGTIQNPNSQTTQVTGLSLGVNTFQLEIIDTVTGLSSISQVSINYQSANIVNPTVSAGSNSTVTLPNGAQLNGQASAGSSAIISDTWTKISGPSGDIISNPNILSTTVSFTQAGTYVYQLKSIASDGGSNTSQVSILVNPVPVTQAICLINFTDTSNVAPTPYNNIYRSVGNNNLVPGSFSLPLLDGNLNVFGSITINDTLDNTAEFGYTTNNNSGVFLDEVLQTAWIMPNGATIQLNGLNRNLKYDLYFFASWMFPWINCQTTATVNGNLVTFDPKNNQSNLTEIASVVPDSSGAITITISKPLTSFFSVLNAIKVVSHS